MYQGNCRDNYLSVCFKIEIARTFGLLLLLLWWNNCSWLTLAHMSVSQDSWPQEIRSPKIQSFSADDFQVAVLVFLSFILTWGRFSIAHEVVICCFRLKSPTWFRWIQPLLFGPLVSKELDIFRKTSCRGSHQQAMILRDGMDGLMAADGFFLLVLSEFGSFRLPVGQV